MSNKTSGQRVGAQRRHTLVQVGKQGQAPTNRVLPCPRRYSSAGNFLELIRQVGDAERLLAVAGYRDPEEHTAIIRGIYYGTEWSADYQHEHSPVRNQAFQLYTGTLVAPPDPRPILICNLFEALRAGKDVTNPDRRHLDVGHMYIGLHARQSVVARNATIPTQGGTGLEISTWLGDLGGGCGMLAANRHTAPGTSASTKFRGGSFGDSRNLEGDLAGFLVASPPGSTSPVAPLYDPLALATGLARALNDYLSPSSPSSAWQTRARSFLAMYGVTLPLTPDSRSALVARFAGKIEDFGVWYIVNRLRQTNRLTSATLRGCAVHIHGAAGEIAEMFVNALVYADAHPEQPLRARPPWPTPSPPGAPNSSLSRIADGIDRSSEARKWAEETERYVDETYEHIQDRFRRLRDGIF